MRYITCLAGIIIPYLTIIEPMVLIDPTGQTHWVTRSSMLPCSAPHPLCHQRPHPAGPTHVPGGPGEGGMPRADSPVPVTTSRCPGFIL